MDGALARATFSHASSDDHIDEVRLPAPCRLSLLCLGVAPGGAGEGGAAAAFARDLEAPLDARFACVGARLSVPATGARAYHLQPVLTDHVVLRGRYRGLSVAVYGDNLSAAAGEASAARALGAVAAPPLTTAAGFEDFDDAADGGAGWSRELGPDAARALAGIADAWRDVGTDGAAMRATPMHPNVLNDLRAAFKAAVEEDAGAGAALQSKPVVARQGRVAPKWVYDGAQAAAGDGEGFKVDGEGSVEAEANAGEGAPIGVGAAAAEAAPAEAAPAGAGDAAAVEASAGDAHVSNELPADEAMADGNGDEDVLDAEPPAVDGSDPDRKSPSTFPQLPTLSPSDLDAVAAAAVLWARSTPAASGPSGSPPELDYAVAGALAAAVGARHAPLARRLLAAGLAGGLAAVLTCGGSPPDAVEAALAALDAATRADPAAACESVLGWSLPPVVPEGGGDGGGGGDGKPAPPPFSPNPAAGCYDALVACLLRRLPEHAAAAGLRAAARAAAYAAAADFETAARAVAAGAAGGAAGDSRALQALLAPAGAALTSLADAVARVAPRPRPHADALRADPFTCLAAAPPRAPDGAAVAALGARRVWPLAAALLRAPALHAARLADAGRLPAGTSRGTLAAALAAPLLRPLARLLALCLSAPGGARVMLRDAGALGELACALDGGGRQAGGGDAAGTPPRGTGAATATGLRAALGCAAGAARLAAAPPESPAAAAAAASLVEAAVTEAGRRGVVAALAADAAAFDATLAAVEAPHVAAVGGKRGRRAKGRKAMWRADAQHAADLLATLSRDAAPAVLARWGAVAPRAARALSHAPKGASRAARAAAEAGARAAALADGSHSGVGAVVLALAASLPPLQLTDPRRPGMRMPVPRLACELVADAGALGSIHARLSLLAVCLRQRGGARAAAAVADVGGLGVLEAAVRVGAAALVSGNGDGLWQTAAGDGIDEAEAAELRARAADLATAAARSLGALAHRLRSLGAASGGAAAADALLALHAAASTAPESLAALRGAAGADCAAAAPVLAARAAAARALAAWVSGGGQPPWAPDLVPNALCVGRAGCRPPPAVDARGPGEALAALALLGDVLPGEWPPAGAARAARPHPPPSRMRFRAALARSCQPVADGLHRLVADAADAEPAVARAALVRFVSRAAGLGGGMGTFLCAPLVDALRAAAAPGAPPGAARRVLEVLVPLAYRPAVKAALLDLGAAGALARLLARLVPTAAASAAAAARVTMALEASAALANPGIALDPALPADVRGAADGPPRPQAATLTAVLLASLPRLGANAHVAQRVISSLAATGPGRASLAAAAVKWKGQVDAATGVGGKGKKEEGGGTGGDAAADDDAATDGFVGSDADKGPRPTEALAWAVARLHSREDQGDAAAAKAVAAVLEAAAADGDVALGAPPPDVPPAPQRFAAAVAEAVRAAAGTPPEGEQDLVVSDASSSDGDMGEPASAAPAHYCDAAARVFWRNIAARSAGAPPPPRGGEAPVGWDLPPGAPQEAACSVLPVGLAPRKRPRCQALVDLPGAPSVTLALAATTQGGGGR